MKQIFKPARQDKISTLIIKQIRSAILTGKYRPGDALPTENELVAQFAVSKHTVREALRALEGMGFITIRRGAGGGPVVCRIDWETARESFANFIHFQNISIQELFEMRLLLEPYLARKAAESFTPEQLAELEAAHGECEALVMEGKSLLSTKSVSFHVLLAKHSGNSALWVVLDFVNSILIKTKHEIQPGPEFSLRVLHTHRAILKAIKEKDGDAAERLMRADMLHAQTGLVELLRQSRGARVEEPLLPVGA